ncbi:MAG: NAD-dependent epimerase/dehydratase family protein, partial [Rhodothermaceae bacterium]|nr:NAD-dependent epimerase/dehydratase family protein [Rhodothermaceae bacterium]
MHLVDPEASINVAGHNGLLGRSIVKKLRANRYRNLLLRSSSELDLRAQSSVNDFFAENRPEYVILAA